MAAAAAFVVCVLVVPSSSKNRPGAGVARRKVNLAAAKIPQAVPNFSLECIVQGEKEGKKFAHAIRVRGNIDGWTELFINGPGFRVSRESQTLDNHVTGARGRKISM